MRAANDIGLNPKVPVAKSMKKASGKDEFG
jgi:hypothetical protein